MKLPTGDFVGYLAVGRVDGDRRFNNSNCLCDLAKFEGEIEVYLLCDLNGHAGGRGAKTLFEDRKFIICRSHVGKNEDAIPVGRGILFNVGRNVCECDFGIWNSRSLGILHRAAHRAIMRLREE